MNLLNPQSAKTELLITFPDYAVRAGVPLQVAPVDGPVGLLKAVVSQLEPANHTDPQPALKLSEAEVRALVALASHLPLSITVLVDPEQLPPPSWAALVGYLPKLSVRELQAPPADGTSARVAAAHRTAEDRVDSAKAYATLVQSQPRVPASAGSAGTGLPDDA